MTEKRYVSFHKTRGRDGMPLEVTVAVKSTVKAREIAEDELQHFDFAEWQFWGID